MRILLLSGSFLPAAIIAGLVPLATRAQSEDSAATAATTAVGTLQEVVVTAQRRSESLQRAAIPVDVVGGDALTQANVTAAAQLTQLVPALTVQAAGGANTTFFVRGIGNFTVNGYSDPAIAFYHDGVYVGRPTSTSGVFYDLARIEVLKGPQGTLYGRNATAGAINVIPARPELGVFSGSAIASYGNFDARNFQGALNIPVGDTSALRLSASVVNRNGYLSDGTGDEENEAARLQFATNLTDSLRLRIGTDYSHTGGLGSGSTYLVNFRYDAAAGPWAANGGRLPRSYGTSRMNAS